eukprot:scaffold87164_cov56-Attheya_sp.AAC.2
MRRGSSVTCKTHSYRGKYSFDQSSRKKVIQNEDANPCQAHQERAIENKAENSFAESGKRMTVTDWDESVSGSLTDSEYTPSLYNELKQNLEVEYSVNEKSVSTGSSTIPVYANRKSST